MVLVELDNLKTFWKVFNNSKNFAAGDFKTGPEPYTSDRMSDEAKANLAFYDPLWKMERFCLWK